MKTAFSLLRPLLLIAALVAAAAGCSQTSAGAYADRYTAALERLPGTTQVTPAMTERFVAFFSHEGSADPGDIYGEPLYFSDTLVTTDERTVALRHLRRMRDAAGSLQVHVLDELVRGADVYLIWQMQASFKALGREADSNTVGVTHLRFDEDGRIILHQDFWDSAEGFYGHVPVLGGLINTVKGRFADAD
ncbi:MAG: nuclear transport factor 2 family protein [Gammaproteobacteria bacterium]|nr:nuclear transport factor 2 family protein [Gammaproteobacteria bacterium]